MDFIAQTKPLVIPNDSYIIPPVNFPSSVSSPGTVNSASTNQPREWQLASIAAVGTVLPLIYGADKVSAKYLDVFQQGNKVWLVVVWALGACVGVQSIEDSNGDKLPAGVTVRHYDGSQALPDPALKAAYTALGKPFDAALTNRCYSVIEIPSSGNIDPGNWVALVKGMKVFDPRDPAQNLNASVTWQWSDNPALCLADFLSNARYGYGKKVDWESVKKAADYCDEPVGTERRWTINWAIIARQPIGQLIEALRTYANCHVVYDGDVLQLVPDAPAPVVYEFDGKDFWETPTITRVGVDQTPTVMRVVYTDTTQSPWQDREAYAFAPGVIEGTERWSESNVSLPGIHTYSEAKRCAVERLLKLILGDLEISGTIRNIGIVFQVGDIVRIPHPVFPEGKLFRIADPVIEQGHEKYRLACKEWQPQMHSNDEYAQPEYGDTTLPDPKYPPPVEMLTIREDLKRQNNAWVTALFASWQKPEWAYTAEYIYELYADNVLIDEGTVFTPSYTSAGVEEGKNYILRVATKTRAFVSPWTSVGITAQGKWLPPGNVPRFTEVLELNGTVYLAWQEAIDIDIERYEIRRAVDIGLDLDNLDDAQADMLWQMGKLLNQVDTLRVELPLQPPATWIYMVKAIDSVGNYSLRPLAVRLEVTLDSNARFVDEWELGVLTLQNAAQWTAHPEYTPRYTTDHGDPIGYGHADANDASGSFADLATQPFALPHSAGVSSAATHMTDVGQTLAGEWVASADVTDHSGAHRFILELSDDAVTWRQNAGAQGQAAALEAARFARVRVESDGAFTLTGDALLRFAVFPREQTGEIMVGATGTYVVVVPGRWASYVDVSVEYVGLDGKQAVRGDVIINNGVAQFEVQVRDADGRAGGKVHWRFKGV